MAEGATQEEKGPSGSLDMSW